MRVLASVLRYPPRSRVGAFLSTHEFLRGLVARGHDVTVATRDHDLGELDGVRLVDPGAFDEEVARADVAICHLHDGDEGAWSAQRAGVPIVRLVHGGGEPKALERLERYPPALTVFLSRTIADELRGLGFAGRFTIARPPIELTIAVDVAGTERRAYGRVTLVNLSELKGGRLFWRIAAAMPDIDFLGVLGGWGEQVIDTPIPANVKVIPPTANMGTDVYSRTRLLLMPSERETFGRVALEAAAFGIPTIASKSATGVAEALPYGRVDVAGTDVDRWVSAIRATLEPSPYRLLASQALDVAFQYRPELELARFATAVEDLAAVPA